MSHPALFPRTHYDLVVLAASAGGLPTILQVLNSIPTNFPAPIIFIQHLSPDHPSRLSEILSRKTELAVKEAEDQETVHPGNLYVSPPGQHLTINSDGRFHLSPSQPIRHQRPSADRLLESAAEAFQDRLIAVILSGMGADGSEGVRAVKHGGGLVIVEDPQKALFASMPESAIQTGQVDWILPVDQIGAKLTQLVSVDSVI